MVARRIVLGATLLLAAGTPRTAASQQSVADSLWKTGQRSDALSEYRRVLAGDSNAVRANFRVAEAIAGTNIDSALRFIRNARVRVPDDPDLMFTEAKYLSWARRFSEAVLLYDSILVAHADFDYVRVTRARVLSWSGHLDAAEKGYRDVIARNGPDRDARRDAAFGLAQVATWQGNLASAADQYASLLADDPNEVRVLVGLAAVRNYQGRPFAADALLKRALTFDSANTDALALKATVRHSRAPSLEVNASWSHDTDDNDVSWQTATQTFVIQDGARIVARIGNQRALDPLRSTSRYLGDVVATVSPGSMQLTGGVGVRQLDVGSAPVGSVPDRAEFTWRGMASMRTTPRLSVGLTVEHLPFDEIATLLASGIDITNVEASADWRLRPTSNLALSGGTLGFSDGNRRNGGSIRISQTESHGLTVGFLARTFSFAHHSTTYFTPEQFLLGDPYASWDYGNERWSFGVSGGVGVQRLGPHNPAQAEWHADGRAGLHFSNGASIDVFAGSSTSASASAAATTVGSFRYETGGISARIPF